MLGVRRVRSRTIRGATEISVLFNPDMDMQYALQLLQARVSDVRTDLPASTDISVERITPTAWPILMFVLNGNVPDSDLRDYAYYNLRPLFNRVPGVALVEVEASYTREVSVIVDPQKMLAHRLSLPDIADRLRATNGVTSVGRLDKDYSRYLVLATGQFTDLDDIRNSVVAVDGQTPIRVRDIGEVRDGVEDPRMLVYGNDQAGRLDQHLAPDWWEHPASRRSGQGAGERPGLGNSQDAAPLRRLRHGGIRARGGGQYPRCSPDRMFARGCYSLPLSARKPHHPDCGNYTSHHRHRHISSS